jgi:hypothetical protein
MIGFMLLLSPFANAQRTNTWITGSSFVPTYHPLSGDIDHDGDLDMIVENANNGFIHRYINNGSGSFTDIGTIPGLRYYDNEMAMGDVDNDGDADLVVPYNEGTNPITFGKIWINNGSGSFAPMAGTYLNHTGSYGFHTQIADINQDGKNDILYFGVNGAYNEIWLNTGTTGNPAFTFSQEFDSDNNRFTSAINDIDGDGDLDIVTGGNAYGNDIFTNNGGAFTQSASINDYSACSYLIDWDQDGDKDLLTYDSYNNSGLKLRRNDGLGNFETNPTVLFNNAQLGGGNLPFLFEFADVNRDGFPDAVVNYVNTAGSVRVLINHGCFFTLEPYTLGTGTGYGLATGDFNGDGFTDIYAGFYNTNSTLFLSDLLQTTPVLYSNILSTAPGMAPTDGSATLTATASNGGTLRWWADATGGSVLATGNSFNTPPISSATTFYVSAINSNGCESARTAVTATVQSCSIPSFSNTPGNMTVNPNTDDCRASVAYTVSVTGSPEPSLTYTLSGAATDAGQGTGSGTVFNYGQTTVEVTATNSCGSRTYSFTIDVSDQKMPIVLTKNITLSLDANGNGVITPADINNGSSDACGIASLSLSKTNFTCANIGNNNVTLTVTDVNGNSSTGVAVVSVKDVTAPEIVCATDVSVNNDLNKCGAVVNFNKPTATDACSGGSANPIVNGSFEDNYNGWTIVSGSCGIWAIGNTGQTLNASQAIYNYGTNSNSSVTYPQGLPVTFAPTDGTKMAAFFQNCGAIHKLYQDVTLPYGNVGLTFDMKYRNFAGAFSTSQYVAIEVVNPSNGAVLATLFKTDSDDPQSINMTSFSFNLSTFAGQTVRIQMVDAVIQSNPLNVFIDNVKISGGINIVQTAGLPSGSLFPVGTTTNTFVATDSSGNSSTCSFDVTVEDNQAPKITCPSNISLIANSAAGAEVNFSTPAATDNCSATVAQIAGLASGSVFPTGMTTVTFRATDDAGNYTDCSFTVHVTGLPPAIVSPGTITSNTESGNCNAHVTYAAAETTGIPTSIITYSIAPGSVFPVGTTQVTATATNAVGSSSCTFDVVVEDHEAPVAVAQNISVNLDASGNVSITAEQLNNGSSDVCGIASLSIDKTAFNCSNVGANTVVLTVKDVNGNISTAPAIVTVNDTTPPVAVTQNISLNLDASGNVTITAAQIDNGSSDLCGIASIGLSKTTFNCSNVGTNTVILTVTDVNGNVKTASAVVTINDTIKPVVITKNITVSLNASGTATIDAAAVNNGSSDACGIAIMSVNKTTFNCSNVGPNTVILTVKDVNGNENSATASVTISDVIPPAVITKAATIYLNASGNAALSVAQVNNGSSDACGIALLSIDKTSFTCANTGSNTVILTALDINGNSATAAASVVVRDTIKPVVKCKTAQAYIGSNGSVTLNPQSFNNGSSDNCMVSLTTIPATLSCSNIGINKVVLVGTDPSGNTSTCTTYVYVSDTSRPVIPTPANMVVYVNGNTCKPLITLNVTATDNCDANVDIDYDLDEDNRYEADDDDDNERRAGCNHGHSHRCQYHCNESHSNQNTSFYFPTGETMVKVTAKDNYGNASVAYFKVTVIDSIKPAVRTKNITVYLNDGEVTISASSVNNNSSDNCSIKKLSVTPSKFDCSNIGNNTVTLTATDASNNISTATAVVNVSGVKPSCSITATPSGTTIGSSSTEALPNQMFIGYGKQSMTLSAVATGGGSFSYKWTGSNLNTNGCGSNSAVFTPTAAGSYTFTCTVTNSYGCQSSCTVTICVIDARDPNSNANNPKVLLCHVPSGNQNNRQTLSVSVNAVASHLSQHDGDKLGSCNAVCGFAKSDAIAEVITEETPEGEVNLIVYPNPSNNEFNFRIESNSTEEATVTIYDITGKMVLEIKGKQPHEVITVSGELSVGVYVAKVTQGSFNKSVKITKVN